MVGQWRWRLVDVRAFGGDVGMSGGGGGWMFRPSR